MWHGAGVLGNDDSRMQSKLIETLFVAQIIIGDVE